MEGANFNSESSDKSGFLEQYIAPLSSNVVTTFTPTNPLIVRNKEESYIIQNALPDSLNEFQQIMLKSLNNKKPTQQFQLLILII